MKKTAVGNSMVSKGYCHPHYIPQDENKKIDAAFATSIFIL